MTKPKPAHGPLNLRLSPELWAVVDALVAEQHATIQKTGALLEAPSPADVLRSLLAREGVRLAAKAAEEPPWKVKVQPYTDAAPSHIDAPGGPIPIVNAPRAGHQMIDEDGISVVVPPDLPVSDRGSMKQGEGDD